MQPGTHYPTKFTKFKNLNVNVVCNDSDICDIGNCIYVYMFSKPDTIDNTNIQTDYQIEPFTFSTPDTIQYGHHTQTDDKIVNTTTTQQQQQQLVQQQPNLQHTQPNLQHTQLNLQHIKTPVQDTIVGPRIERFDVGRNSLSLSMPRLSDSEDSSEDEDEDGPQTERSSGCPELGGAGEPRNEILMEVIHENLKPSASQLPRKGRDNAVEDTVHTLSQTLTVDMESGAARESTSDEPSVRLVDGVMIVELCQSNLSL